MCLRNRFAHKITDLVTESAYKDIKKILCIKLKGIGDVILSSITFDNLAHNFPNAEIHYLTEPPSAPLLRKLPVISKVHLFRKKEKFAAWKTIYNIRKEKFDLVLDFYSNPRTALITYLSGARLRAGFPYRGREYAYNLFGPEERAKHHAAELHNEFLRRIGLSVNTGKLHFGMDSEDIRFADEFFDKNFSRGELIIGLSPTGGWESKKCDADILFSFADAISRKTGGKVLILWGPGDEKDAETIYHLSEQRFVMAPPSTITQLGALIKKCTAMLGNDSGPMHIASAVGTPVLGLFGPTDPKLQGPFGEKNGYIHLKELDCITCNLLVCPKQHECFRELSAEAVYKKFLEILPDTNG